MNNKLFFLYSLFSSFFIILAIQISNGLFGWIAFGLVVISFFLEILSIRTLFKAESPISISDILIPVAIFLVMLEIGLGLFKPYIKYNQIFFFPLLLKIINGIGLILIATYFLKECPKFLKNRFIILFLINVLGKVLVIWASPYPIIDVWQNMQTASKYFILGVNPYAFPVCHIDNNLKTISFNGFFYWPMALISILPFYIIFGDVRVAMITLEAIGIIVLYRLVKKNSWQCDTLKWFELVILMFLLQPRGFLVIEQSWNEPLIIGILALFLYGYYLRYRWSDFFLGLFLAFKQNLIFSLIPLFNLYRFKYRRYLIVIFTFMLIVLPFLFWDMEAFWGSSVKLHLDLASRFDALTLTSFLRHGFFINLPTWIGPTLTIIAGIIGTITLKRFGLPGYLKSLVLTYLVLFIFGKQAFCNYYYFLTFLQMAAIFFFTMYIKSDK